MSPLYSQEIQQALNQFVKEDHLLIKNNVSERAITHKIAEHLQQLLPDWHIDCEYNRKLKQRKTANFKNLITDIDILLASDDLQNIRAEHKTAIEQLLAELHHGDIRRFRCESGNQEYILLSDDDGSYVKPIYPDIIAHRRNTMLNKIVIEVKINGRNHNISKNRIFDLAKLAVLTDPKGEYKYDVGYFITLPNKVTPTTIVGTPKQTSFLAKLPKRYHNVYEIDVAPIKSMHTVK